MTVFLIDALYAAERLAGFHRDRAEQAPLGLGAIHRQTVQILEADIARIRRELNSAGVSVENQAHAVYAHDMRTAQEIVTTHILMEWRADERASKIMVEMAKAIADAIQVGRGAKPAP
jgi:hypothetical protein